MREDHDGHGPRRRPIFLPFFCPVKFSAFFIGATTGTALLLP
jgi:hypothetical protein